MGICDNETSKIYSELNRTAPQEPQACCLKSLTEIKGNLLDEKELCERLIKKMIQFNTITNVMNTGLIASATITGSVQLVHLLAYYSCSSN